MVPAVKSNEQLSHYSFVQNADYSDSHTVLRRVVSQFGRQLDKPKVILFDEIDCLSNGTRISFEISYF
jgi:hypothetical protein